jgi:SMC interacting uncharacterized protein involved in chromosome segregation
MSDPNPDDMPLPDARMMATKNVIERLHTELDAAHERIKALEAERDELRAKLAGR